MSSAMASLVDSNGLHAHLMNLQKTLARRPSRQWRWSTCSRGAAGAGGAPPRTSPTSGTWVRSRTNRGIGGAEDVSMAPPGLWRLMCGGCLCGVGRRGQPAERAGACARQGRLSWPHLFRHRPRPVQGQLHRPQQQIHSRGFCITSTPCLPHCMPVVELPSPCTC